MTLRFEQGERVKIPARFKDAKFDENTSDGIRALGVEFTDNFENYYRKGIGPALFGLPGTGKTHAAAAITRILDKNGVPCFWSNVVQDISKLLERRDFRNQTEYYELKRQIVGTSFVVLDDFTYLQKMQRQRELFFELLDARYSKRLPTLFTGNFATDDTKTPWNAITSSFGGAVSRRIKIMSEGLLFVA